MKLIIAVLLLLTICYSCKKKDDGRVKQPLNATVVNMIPYKDGQVVAFITNKQGTITTVVHRNFQILNHSIPFVSEEYLEVNLKRSDTNSDFISFLARGSSAADSAMQFNITPYGDFYNIIQFKAHINGTMSQFLYNGTAIFHDSFMLNNITYTKVLELNWNSTENVRAINRLFYNAAFGVLHYETKDGLIGDMLPSK